MVDVHSGILLSMRKIEIVLVSIWIVLLKVMLSEVSQMKRLEIRILVQYNRHFDESEGSLTLDINTININTIVTILLK